VQELASAMYEIQGFIFQTHKAIALHRQNEKFALYSPVLRFGGLQWICIANGSVTIHWVTVLLKQKIALVFGNSSYMGGEKVC